jgi:hypothetical protein
MSDCNECLKWANWIELFEPARLPEALREHVG